MNVKPIVSSALIITLLSITLFVPWWNITLTEHAWGTYSGENIDYELTGAFDYGLTDLNVRVNAKQVYGEDVTEKSEEQSYPYKTEDEDTIAEVCIQTYYILIASICLWIAVLIFMILSAFRIIKKIPIIIPVIALIVMIITPIFFASVIPSALEKEVGEKSYGGVELFGRDLEIHGFLGGDSVQNTYPWGGVYQYGSMSAMWYPSFGWGISIFSILLGILCLKFTSAWNKEAEKLPAKKEKETLTHPSYPTIQLRCKKCGFVFRVNSAIRPITIECPRCGSRGTLR